MVLIQRISIYSQLYLTGGLFINPSTYKGLSNNFKKSIDNKYNIYLFSPTKKSLINCNYAAKRHLIRNGKPERSVQFCCNFIYSKKKNHPFWIDLIKLSQNRYNNIVPNNENIESISKYGKEYLVGSDLLSEAFFKFGNKYSDIFIINNENIESFTL